MARRIVRRFKKIARRPIRRRYARPRTRVMRRPISRRPSFRRR